MSFKVVINFNETEKLFKVIHMLKSLKYQIPDHL